MLTYRRLLDNVEDGDGQLCISEGVRLGVDLGHGARGVRGKLRRERKFVRLRV